MSDGSSTLATQLIEGAPADVFASADEETIRRVREEKRRESRLRRQCSAFDRWEMNDAKRVTPLVERLDAMKIPRIAHPRAGLLVMTNGRSFPAAASRAVSR